MPVLKLEGIAFLFFVNESYRNIGLYSHYGYTWTLGSVSEAEKVLDQQLSKQ